MSTTQRFAGTIAVTGATGQLASQTVEFLLKLAPEANLVALVRDPSKARSLPAQGTDNYAPSLGKLFANQGHSVYFGSRTPELTSDWANTIGSTVQVGTYRQAAQFGDVVVMATPWPGNGTADALNAMGLQPGKILLDATNALQTDYSPFPVEQASSAAEEIARLRPAARVVKGLNAVSGYTLTNGLRFGDTTVSGFYGSDDTAAKDIVGQLVSSVGLAAVDAGPLRNAHHLVSLDQLLIYLAFNAGMGVDSGFAFLHRQTIE